MVNYLFPRQQPGENLNSDDNSPSLSQLYWTLVPAFLFAAAYVTLWLILRPKLKRNYAPRSYVKSLREQYILTHLMHQKFSLTSYVGNALLTYQMGFSTGSEPSTSFQTLMF